MTNGEPDRSEISAGDGADHLLYPFGFLIGDAAAWVPSHFIPLDEPGIRISIHPWTQVRCVDLGGERVLIIGEHLHPDDTGGDDDFVARHFPAERSLQQAFIDRLIGRFVVIRIRTSDRSVSIQTDAIGLRAVYFSRAPGSCIAGSHAGLVARARAGAPVSAAALPHKWGYPGMSTPFPGVLRVPPNCELFLDDGALQRFFPLDPVPPCALETAWDFALDQAGRAMRLLASRNRILMSLSGGLDSRTTLAAARPVWDRVEFFTYHETGSNPERLRIDLHIARDIVARLGLRHTELAMSRFQPPPEALLALRENVFTRHMHGVASAYLTVFACREYVHVRSNLLELFRAGTRTDPPASGGAVIVSPPDSASAAANHYLSRGKFAQSGHEHVLSAFEQFFAETDFARACSMVSPWDLYFIEHRMGAWQAGVVAESDLAFDTVIAFNSRAIIRRFLGVPERERRDTRYLESWIAASVPEIADIPVNPDTYPL